MEEQQLRTSSLPAIPNPFPELCSPTSSPVLSPGSLPPGEPSTAKYVSQRHTVKTQSLFTNLDYFQELRKRFGIFGYKAFVGCVSLPHPEKQDMRQI